MPVLVDLVPVYFKVVFIDEGKDLVLRQVKLLRNLLAGQPVLA